mgnify:CR=1 FL=1
MFHLIIKEVNIAGEGLQILGLKSISIILTLFAHTFLSFEIIWKKRGIDI